MKYQITIGSEAEHDAEEVRAGSEKQRTVPLPLLSPALVMHVSRVFA